VDAFLTAVYLPHQQTASLVLAHSSLYHKLLNKDSDYLILRVFGCACYPLLRPYTAHKLQFHTKQCIFLDYSSGYKGYMCFDPQPFKVYLAILSLMKLPCQLGHTTTIFPSHQPLFLQVLDVFKSQTVHQSITQND
jgi:hypothetical protein